MKFFNSLRRISFYRNVLEPRRFRIIFIQTSLFVEEACSQVCILSFQFVKCKFLKYTYVCWVTHCWGKPYAIFFQFLFSIAIIWIMRQIPLPLCHSWLCTKLLRCLVRWGLDSRLSHIEDFSILFSRRFPDRSQASQKQSGFDWPCFRTCNTFTNKPISNSIRVRENHTIVHGWCFWI